MDGDNLKAGRVARPDQMVKQSPRAGKKGATGQREPLSSALAPPISSLPNASPSYVERELNYLNIRGSIVSQGRFSVKDGLGPGQERAVNRLSVKLPIDQLMQSEIITKLQE